MSVSATQPHQLWPTGTPSATLPSSSMGMDPLERERREVERRRARFADRKSRILQAKQRIIGIDANALEAQVREKEQQKKKELEDKQFYETLQESNVRVLTEAERERQRQRIRSSSELAHYRKAQETERRRRETAERQAQLQQAQLVKDYAAQHGVSMEDAIAACKEKTVFLDFKGEDLDKSKREDAQKRQQQEWLTQQLMLQEEQQAKSRQEVRDHAAQERRINDIKKQMETEAAESRARTLREQQQYNSQLATERKHREQQNKQLNQLLAEKDLETHVQSQLLNEKMNDDVPRTAFKGFSEATRLAILAEQKRQQDELGARRAREAQDAADWAKTQEEMRREMVRQDRARQTVERQKNVEVLHAQLGQRKEQKEIRSYLDRVVYQNPVSDSYFEQFGTSHR